MKKIIAVILTTVFLISLSVTAFADIDLSGMSYDELVALKDQINLAIWNSEEWQEVTVPQGVWEIGKDIPEGYWSLKMSPDSPDWSSWCAIKYCKELDSTKTQAIKSSGYIYQQMAKDASKYNAPEQFDIYLEAGHYLIIDNADIVFSPYAGKPTLGFK